MERKAYIEIGAYELESMNEAERSCRLRDRGGIGAARGHG